MTERRSLRFDLYSWGALTLLLIATGAYFAFHLAWNLILVSFLLVCIGAISAVGGFYRTWRKSPFGSRPVDNDPLKNPKVRIFRFIIWALLMCVAGVITAHFAPDKVVFVPGVFLAILVPMVLILLRDSGRGPASKAGLEKSVKLLWVVGNCLWCSTVPFLWWRGYQAQTAAQASIDMTRLEMVSGLGGLWAVAGAVWLTKFRKPPKTYPRG